MKKILAVPTNKIDVTFENIKDIDGVPQIIKDRINHFFENYKKLEKGKWVKIVGWENAKKALDIIEEAITRAK